MAFRSRGGYIIQLIIPSILPKSNSKVWLRPRKGGRKR